MNPIRFEDYRNLLQQLAWSVHKSTGIEQEELFGIGSLAFVSASRNYDPELHWTFSTYLTNCARNAMLSCASRESRSIQTTEMPTEMIDDSPPPDRFIRFSEMLSLMSEGAQTVCRIIFNSPAEILDAVCCNSNGDDWSSIVARRTWTGRKAIPSAIRRYMMKNGFTSPQVYRAFREVREGLREM